MSQKNVEAPIIIQWRIKEWFPDLSEKTLGIFKKYHEELLKFNDKLNLISTKTVPVADNLHFADCIMAMKYVGERTEPVFDFGSGNGFPGLIYAILFSKTPVVLVEIDQRKAEFLKHMIGALTLSNCKVQVSTVESLPEHSVGVAISRGFAGLAKSLLTARKCVKRGGLYYHMKSEEWAAEVADLPTQLCTFWEPSLVSDYRLPVGEINYSVIQTKKLND